MAVDGSDTMNSGVHLLPLTFDSTKGPGWGLVVTGNGARVTYTGRLALKVAKLLGMTTAHSGPRPVHVWAAWVWLVRSGPLHTMCTATCRGAKLADLDHMRRCACKIYVIAAIVLRLCSAGHRASLSTSNFREVNLKQQFLGKVNDVKYDTKGGHRS